MKLETQTSNEWHIMKGENQFGPYTYQEMLHMKQNNLLFDFDNVWSPNLSEWTLVADLPDFSVDRMSRLVEQQTEMAAFAQRSSPRLNVELDAYVHDDTRLWMGKVLNISLGGALVLMENPLLLPGQILTLHLKAGQGIQSGFCCTIQVLNKRLIKTRIKHDTAIHYVVKFLELTEAGTTEMQRLFDAASSANNSQQQKLA